MGDERERERADGEQDEPADGEPTRGNPRDEDGGDERARQHAEIGRASCRERVSSPV